MRIKTILLALFSLAWMSNNLRAQDLRVFETTHYRIHTDLDDDLSDELGRRMDAMYEEYAHRLADFQRNDDSAPLEAYLVHSKEKYLHLVGLTMAGTGGSFSPTRHLLAAYLDGPGRDAIRRTLQHEAFHQFAASSIGRTIPVWLNEGLAQIFEEGVWAGGQFVLGQVPPRRLLQLRQDIARSTLIDFPSLLKMTGAQWAISWRDPPAAATEYNQSWAMTHFLIYATDDSGKPKYRMRLIQMLRLLQGGADGESAFHDAFSGNITGFHDRFIDYASTLSPTPLALAIENQGIMADMLIHAHDRHRNFTTIAAFHDAAVGESWRLKYQRGNLQWESDPDPDVYFHTPEGGELSDNQLYFDPTPDRPMPDLLCRYDGLPTLRTRFLQSGDVIEHETLVE
jgi:hypothetical protein